MDLIPALSDPRLRGLDFQVVTHERVGSLEEAAILRGVDPSAMIKTMVVRRAEEEYVFVLVPGDRVIDWPKLRAHLGERRLTMPDAAEAKQTTGYVRGTITPFGAKVRWPVIADQRIDGVTVSIGGGAPGSSLTMKGSDLIRVLEATLAEVTKERTG